MKKVVLFIFLFFTIFISTNGQVTYINTALAGHMNLNDMTNSNFSYGPLATLESKPDGSTASLILNTDGSYTFVGDVVGTYIYDVPVCLLPEGTECFSVNLKIQVVDFLESEFRPIVFKDLGTTEKNTTITLKTLANDRCVVTNGCVLDMASVSIVSPPSQGGSATVNDLNGNISYTPSLDFSGNDTLTYQVCVEGDALNCITAEQIITVLSGSESNFTLAVDDFTSTPQGTAVTGNVLNNDIDAEGDAQSAIPQEIILAEGKFTLSSNGEYTFEPEEAFFGPLEILYSVCDNNSSAACSDASLHILVVKDLSVRVRVYLVGSLLNNGNETGSTHERPLMRDNLRVSPFTSKRYIPDNDPYSSMSATSWESKKEKYVHVGPGLLPKFATISEPEKVFDVSGEDAITDWVFVELRSQSDYTMVAATRSGLVQRDGDVVDLDGVSGLRFPGLNVDDYYVIIRHRSHLDAMTAEAKSPGQLFELVDFTKEETGIFDFGNTKFEGIYDYTNLAQNRTAKQGYLALWGGDFNGDGKIKYASPGGDLNVLFGTLIGYDMKDDAGEIIGQNYFTNYDLVFGYHNGDFDMNSKARYDNPNDDKNMVFGELLFYKLNSRFSYNFDFFIEQIPE